MRIYEKEVLIYIIYKIRNNDYYCVYFKNDLKITFMISVKIYLIIDIKHLEFR